MLQNTGTGLEPIQYSGVQPRIRTELLRIGDVNLNMLTGEIAGPGGTAVLTPACRMLLEHLGQRAGEPVSKWVLEQRFCRNDIHGNSLSVQISHIRSALRRIGSAQVRIQAVRGWGSGYKLESGDGEATVNLLLSLRQYRELQNLLAKAEGRLPGVRARIGL